MKKWIFLLLMTLSSTSFALSYQLIVPKNLKADPTLVTLLHGCTQTIKSFIGLTKFTQIAEEKNLIILVPAQSLLRNPGKCWNWYAVHKQIGKNEMTSIVSLINKYAQEYKTRNSYLFGFSAGAAMGANLLALNSSLFDGVLLHSGYPFHGEGVMKISDFSLYEDGAEVESFLAGANEDLLFLRSKMKPFHSRLKNIVIVSGQKDLIASHKYAKASFVQFLDHTSLLTKTDHSDYRIYQAQGRWRTTLYQMPQMGHAWSGGDGRYLFADPEQLDITQESLRLFAQ